ncbi:hypothetical protein SISNIDRAFT_488278 [Sistotremastrum niveocremeum HHB9708]|uniref:Uncharacterized protein n=1 Tax=Sistotremastrum niveocremeum HHB9708 TaxID=1314777 RepID=A0A164RAC4_9AGAM|nr:hypothetical protein SISNIDRAFT_488278 [Sistotremastrum niveocremeum HHB9708]
MNSTNLSAGGAASDTVQGLMLGQHAQTILLFWFSVMIVAQAGLFVLLLTFCLSKSITPRDPALINLTLISFLETFVYLILRAYRTSFYNGSYMDQTPPFTPCLTQAVLKHGLDMGYVTAVFILIVETWLSLRRLGKPPRNDSTALRLYITISTPYLASTFVVIPVIVYAMRFPESVLRESWAFYCTISNTSLGQVSQSLQGVLAAGTLICQGLIVRLIIIHRSRNELLSTNMLDASKGIRVGVFLILEIILLLFSSGMFEAWVVLRTSVLAVAPILLLGVFATQSDLFRVWFPCWGAAEDTSTKTMDLMTRSQWEQSCAEDEFTTVVVIKGNKETEDSKKTEV